MRYLCSLFVILSASLVLAGDPIPLETCQMCHEDTADAFLASAHGRAIAAQSADLLSKACATCHEATEAHIDDPSPSNIRRQPSRDACVSCHVDRSSRLDLVAPAHQRNKVSCLSCHNVGHSSPDTEVLPTVNRRCIGCHPFEASRFELPFAHREGTRAFDCTECHTMHATSRKGRLSLQDESAPCVACHSEKRLPFAFPHPPDNRRGCMSCHTPHGSTAPRQLVRNRISSLCLECHTGVPSSHDLSSARYQNCTNCHSAIHGSNRDPKLFRN